MILFKIFGISLVTTALTLIIRQHRPDIAFAVSLSGASVAFLVIVSYLESYISTFTGMFSDAGVLPEYFSIALKAVGIGYISEFAANIAADSGQSAMASKVLFAGKSAMLILALPLIKNLLDLAIELVGK